MSPLLRSVAIASVLGCGAAQPAVTTPERPAPAGLTPEALSAALIARFEERYCEADHCYDPFPLWAVTGMAVSDDRIALAGPGALLSLYQDGAWTTLVAPVDDTDPTALAVHDVAFSPDGAQLVAVGGRGRVWDVTRAGMTERARVGDDTDDEILGTLSSVIVVSPDEVWVIEAEGRVFRLRAGTIDEAETRSAIDHLIAVPDHPLEEALIVSGPFGSLLVEDVFGEHRTTEHMDELQSHTLGEYSGCGEAGLDERSEEVATRAEELLADDPDLEEAVAYARAEAEVPPTTFAPPPMGATIPRSGMPAPGLVEALAATEAGSVIARIVARPPLDVRVTRDRQGDAMALAWSTWSGTSQLWGRLAGGVTHVSASDIGSIEAIDVSADAAVVVTSTGRIAVVRAGDEAFAPGLPIDGLRGVRAVRRVAESRALVLAYTGLFDVDLSTLTAGAPRAVPGALRAIEGEGANVYGVGDDGLVVRIGETIEVVPSGTTADLLTALVTADGVVVAGAAGTIVRLGAGEPRLSPRITGVTIGELRMDGDALFAETVDGVVVAERGGAVTARATDRVGEYGAVRTLGPLAGAFVPDATLARETRATPFALALDEPGAAAPWGALRERYEPGSDRFPPSPGPMSSVLRSDALREQIFRYDGEAGYCCDPDYPMEDGERLLMMVHDSEPSCEDGDCAWLATIDMRHVLVSLARGIDIIIERTATPCPGYVVREQRLRPHGERPLYARPHEVACSGDPTRVTRRCSRTSPRSRPMPGGSAKATSAFPREGATSRSWGTPQ